MPPCGYRPKAISGVRGFLEDNLNYFCDLYMARGLSPIEAIEIEKAEIARIKAGQRGGLWARTVVPLNELFYEELAKSDVRSWEAVRQVGNRIIEAADRDLDALATEGAFHG